MARLREAGKLGVSLGIESGVTFLKGRPVKVKSIYSLAPNSSSWKLSAHARGHTRKSLAGWRQQRLGTGSVNDSTSPWGIGPTV